MPPTPAAATNRLVSGIVASPAPEALETRAPDEVSSVRMAQSCVAGPPRPSLLA
ncbi:hypothetical protein [Nocardia thraciensis]